MRVPPHCSFKTISGFYIRGALAYFHLQCGTYQGITVRDSLHGFTKSIGLQRFQKICSVSMLPAEVP